MGAEDQAALRIELISGRSRQDFGNRGRDPQSRQRAVLAPPSVRPRARAAGRPGSRARHRRNDGGPLSGIRCPLADATLFSWHELLLAGARDVHVIGGYRTHEDPMQVVSGPIHKRRCNFEAPPSKAMPREMARSSPGSTTVRPTREPAAGTDARRPRAPIFCVHPSFEDGKRPGRPRACGKIASRRI